MRLAERRARFREATRRRLGEAEVDQLLILRRRRRLLRRGDALRKEHAHRAKQATHDRTEGSRHAQKSFLPNVPARVFTSTDFGSCSADAAGVLAAARLR